VTDACPQQPEIVVRLGRRPDSGARGLGRVFLLDRDGGREAVDPVDVGLLHALEKLPCIGGQRLHVPPLSLGVNRIERERRLPGSRRSRHHRERPPRYVEIESFEVVLSCSSNSDVGLHDRKVIEAIEDVEAVEGNGNLDFLTWITSITSTTLTTFSGPLAQRRAGQRPPPSRFPPSGDSACPG
jgi:hypothetical protein